MLITIRGLYGIAFLVLISSCGSYYQVNHRFNQSFENGHLNDAIDILENNKKAEEGKARFLYFANLGVAHSILGNYEISNEYLEQAYLFREDYLKNYFLEAASFVVNPNVLVYPGEDHEHLLLLYYKALNFLKLNKHEEALVECRRLNLRLQQLSDKYKSEKKYQRDAFIHTLMGIIYQADHDYNNAFIAYRNAVEIYQEEYTSMFGTVVPDQLKTDLLRSAHLSGFPEEVARYEKVFDLKYEQDQSKGGDLVFFWHNGLGPVKAEWGINFFLIHGEGGLVNFKNEEFNFNFPFYLNEEEDKDKKEGLEKVEVIRAAFPKYVERPPLFNQGFLEVNNQKHPLEEVENVDAIAKKVLRERMVIEFSKSLLRLGLKKATEYAAREKNEGLGAAIGIFNAITEKADTRNWQTLPHSIHYTRVDLEEGSNEIKFRIVANKDEKLNQLHSFRFEVPKGETYFHTFHSLEITPSYQNPFYYN